MNVARPIVLTVILLACLFGSPSFSQTASSWTVYSDPQREIQFPDILGYTTLKCDFHIHTVFSDGAVWPTVRVEEAWREGLDAVSITDHIEYQPKKNDIPTQHNRPYEIALPLANRKHMLLPRGTEITRDTPPGHFNAIFLNDVIPLDTPEILDAIQAANAQGAFVFWNHPQWKGEDLGQWLDFHETIYTNHWLHGIEVCNGDSYYPTAHRWAIEKNLTMIGGSDIHQPAGSNERTVDNHRTITLVLAKEKTLPSIKEALVAGRTIVWYRNQLIGKEEYLDALFAQSIQIGMPYLVSNSTCFFEISNRSEIDLQLERIGMMGPVEFTIPARSTIQLSGTIDLETDRITLSYIVKNMLVAPNRGLPVTLTVSLQ